jgi:hypothetical protein
MLFTFLSRLIDTFVTVYLPSLLSMFITIFFSSNAFMKPRVAEHNPQTPMKTGSRF